MPLDRILSAAIGGGVGGALGALLAKGIVPKSASPSRRRLLALLPVLVGAALGAQFAAVTAKAPMSRPTSRVERAMLRYAEPVMEAPAVKRRFMAAGVDGARSLGQQLSHAGLKRLGAADLDQWNRVRLLLAASSRAICAGLWTGKIDPVALVAELEKLGEADLDGWARLSANAMRAELAATEPVTLDPEGAAKTLLAAQEHLAPADRERFGKDLEAGDKLPIDEACWVMEQLMRAVATLEPGPREAALRSLAAL